MFRHVAPASFLMLLFLQFFPVSAIAENPQFEGMAAGFVRLSQMDGSIVQEIRYAGAHNFMGQPVPGYEVPQCLLTVKAAEALRDVQAELKPFGLSLKVYDCYRPQQAVNDFVRWAKDLADNRMKAEFYPRVKKNDLFIQGYIAEQSGHSRGSTVDLTIIPNPAPEQPEYNEASELIDCTRALGERFSDNSLDMGTGYDCFDPKSHTENPSIDPSARANRLLLKTLMTKHGFKNLPEEWWHYTLEAESYPNTYFDFPVR